VVDDVDHVGVMGICRR